MNKYAGTKTEKNLEAAFAGESQARNKYTYFASTAKKEGYEQIAALFLKTADNEKEHAKMWFKELTALEIPRRTSERLQTAKITNGLICMRNSPRRRKKRGSLNWLQNSVWWAKWKNITKNVTALF